MEISGSGTVLREYVWLGQEPVALREYELRPGLYFYINDHLGTPQQLVDSQGAVVWQAAALPFGKTQVQLGTVQNNLRFPGQYFDAETGLHYNWNRYYDPATGRYISPDPIGLDGGLNLYAYVGNDPVNWSDPWGLYSLMDFSGDALSFTAGLGNAVTFGGTTWIAKQFMSDEDAAILEKTKRCSGTFKGGEWASLGLGVGRLAYAGLAKGASMVYAARGASMANAAGASAFRNGLKKTFRLNPFSKYRVYPFSKMVNKYGDAKSIIDAAGRTNSEINAIGVTIAGGATVVLTAADDCECN